MHIILYITIPESVTSIGDAAGDAAFVDCSGLKAFYGKFASGDNRCLINNGTLIAFAPSDLTSYTIPDSVTSIGDCAFYDCESLTSVTIPNSVTYIENDAFYGCTNLATVTNYSALNIVRGETSYGYVAYYANEVITHAWLIELNKENLNLQLGETEALKATVYPKFVTVTVTWTSSDEAIATVNNEGKVTAVGLGTATITATCGRVSATCTVTTSVVKTFSEINADGVTIYYRITSSTAPYTVEVTYKDTNYNSYSGNVNIPSSVTKAGVTYSVTAIGENAFRNCTGLTSVTIPEGITSIGKHAFSDCSDLTTVNFNATNCTDMGSQYSLVFSGCTKLTTLNIGDNVQTIPSCAFYGWSGLTSVTIPESVKSIGISAFEGCSGLTSIIIPNSVTTIGSSAFSRCTGLTSVTISESVTSISCFSGCTSLTTVDIPKSVTSIGDHAFYLCSGLTSVTIPEGVTSIGDWAFSDCSGLTSVTIPEAVTSIGNYAFLRCTGLTTLNYNAINCTKLSGSSVFQGCSSFTTLNIGENVQTILYGAFDGCSGLTTINYNATNCTKLGGSSVYFFQQFPNFTTLNIGENVQSIPENAFGGCDALTSVTIPEGVTSIGNYAFSGCDGLTTVNYNATKMSGRYVFSKCSNLTTLNIGKNVLTIPGHTFEYCSRLTYVDIPSSVTSIGDLAFFYCTKLATVTNYSALNIVKGASTHGYVAYYAKDVIKGTTSNKFEIENARVVAGNTLLLPVKMSNEESIVSFSCDVVLPEGLTLAKDEYDDYDITLADRCDGTHVITSSDLDGKIRVVEYSSKNHPFTGNEGTIFYLPIVAADDLESDTELTVKITNIYLTEAETFNEMRSPDVKATLTIKPPFTPGDVNDDGKFSVADVSLAVEFVLGNTPMQGLAEAADANGDGKVSAVDISIIVSYVMSGKVIDDFGQARIKSNTQKPVVEQLVYCGTEANWAKIGLTNVSDYTAAQFDIVLPEGVTVADVRLSNQSTSHQVMFNEMENGLIRVLAYSPVNANFTDGQSFIELQLNGVNYGDIVLTNASVVRNESDNFSEFPAEGCIIYGAISSINGVGTDELIISVENCNIVITAPKSTTVILSDILGRSSVISVEAGRNVIPVVPGIYLVNNKKLVIR